MAKVDRTIFRQYDIRGIFEKDLTEDTVKLIGKAIGTYLARKGFRNIIVGRDARLSSPALRNWLVEGLLQTGMRVTDIGVVPTPVCYFAIYHFDKEGGVMITGSHNPPEYNGFKILAGKETLYGEEIQKLREIIEKEDFVEGEGSVELQDVVPVYQEFIVKNIKQKRPLKLVIDGGNGTGCYVARGIFEALGNQVIPLYCEMDGRFPHHHPDPTVPEYLKDLIETVKREGADLGIAYDGDADRIGVVDEKGRILYGDQILMILMRDVLEANPGAKIISDVKASKFLFEEVERLGGKPIMWKTGHSLIKKKMKEEGALLAGEMSGHMFFADRYYGFDDAIYASARLVEYLSKVEKKLSEIYDELPKAYSTPEIRFEFTEEGKFKLVEEVKKILRQRHPDYQVVDIDGIRINYPDGWALARPSNTQPVIVLRFEASSPEALERIKREMEEAIEEAKKRV